MVKNLSSSVGMWVQPLVGGSEEPPAAGQSQARPDAAENKNESIKMQKNQQLFKIPRARRFYLYL